MKTILPFAPAAAESSARLPFNDCDPLLYELVSHLRQNRNKLHGEWMRRITRAKLLKSFSRRTIVAAANFIYDGYVEALAAGGLEGLRAFLRRLPDRLSLHGVESHDALGLVYLLRDVLGYSLFRQFRHFDGSRLGAPQKNEEAGGESDCAQWSSSGSEHPMEAI